jgi:hypothetical protein
MLAAIVFSVFAVLNNDLIKLIIKPPKYERCHV